MNELVSETPLDLPANYRIYVTGVLESRWVERYWGMTSTPIELNDEPDQTVLAGEVADQAALIGIINELYSKGYTVLSVERLKPDTTLPPEDTGVET